MADQVISNWGRVRFEPGGGNAMLLYVLYGQFSSLDQADLSDYRTAGLPPHLTIKTLSRSEGAVFPFTHRDHAPILAEDCPEVFTAAQDAPQCLILSGEFPDPSDLNYLRDTVGLVAWHLDHGAVAALDAQRLRLYDAGAWWTEVFAPDPPDFARHVGILSSGTSRGTRWFRTRGLRKFGRPDVSLRDVEPDHVTPVLDLFRRLIVLQAEGGRVPEGQPIRMAGLPPGMTCHHAGRTDDPEFNNTHLEIRWPQKYSF